MYLLFGFTLVHQSLYAGRLSLSVPFIVLRFGPVTLVWISVGKLSLQAQGLGEVSFSFTVILLHFGLSE